MLTGFCIYTRDGYTIISRTLENGCHFCKSSGNSDECMLTSIGSCLVDWSLDESLAPHLTLVAAFVAI